MKRLIELIFKNKIKTLGRNLLFLIEDREQKLYNGYSSCSEGAGKNGAFIRMPTPQEKANDIKAEIIKYIPVASTINDIKIVATGSDFYGHVKNEGEIQKTKEGLVLDTGFAIVTAGFGTAAKFTDDLVEGAAKYADDIIYNGLKLDYQLFGKKAFPQGSMNGKEVINFLEKEGFEEISQNGSHVKLKGPDGNIVIVPKHTKDIPKGTLNNIKKQAGYK